MLLYLSAIVLTLAMPFERLQPALTFPGQKLTNLEAVMLVAIVCWIVAVARTRDLPELSTRIAWPVAGIVASMILSALLAGEHRVNSFKFTGRFLAGFAVCLLAIRAVCSSRRALGVVAAALSAAVVVSTLAILEWLEVPAVLNWLTQFRPGVAVVGGNIRATSTLQYPTITSMYLEIVFALGLALFGSAVDRRRWLAAIGTALALLVVAIGVVLTFTRAGLVVLLAVLVASLVMWGLRRGLDRGSVALAVLTVAVGAIITASFAGGLQWLRVTTEQQQGWYQATYDVPERLTLRTLETRLVDVRVRNDGRVTWSTDERSPFRLSYHWLDREGRPAEFDGLRTAFEVEVPPGAEVAVRARVRAPSRPGAYQLAWDVVQEQRLWFSTEGASGPRTAALVEGEAARGVAPPVIAELPRPRPRIGRIELWRAAGRMLRTAPLFGVGPDNFRLEYGRFADIDRPDPRVHANNVYLEFMTGSGLVGGAMFLWLVWRLGRVAVTKWRQAPPDRLPLVMGAAAAVGAILLHGFVDAFFEFTPTYLMIWLALALLVCDEGWPTEVASIQWPVASKNAGALWPLTTGHWPLR
ncbi:MAG: O-antigen ligase family protein [Acidobacteria bacterium]|nr:O-antigen ligase family protein [Acidobacteriota bacterium]